MKDMHNSLDPVQSLLPALRTATVNGAGVSLAGFEGAMFVFDMGVFTGTSPTATVQFQESDDDSTYTVIAAADLGSGVLPVAISTATDNAVLKDTYVGSKPYVRIAITAIGGTSPSLPCAGTVIRGHARHQPV